MKRSVFTKLLSCLLAMVMTFTTLAVSVGAADDNSGKYVKDVFIAYGEEKAKAEEWLRQNGWEPKFDLNDGKTSKAPGFHNAVAVLTATTTTARAARAAKSARRSRTTYLTSSSTATRTANTP